MSCSRSAPDDAAGEHREEGASEALLRTVTGFLQGVYRGQSAPDEGGVTVPPLVHTLAGRGADAPAHLTIVVIVGSAPVHLPEPFLTVADTAKLLKIGEDTVERLVASGQLKASEFSGKGRSAGRKFKRIRREALEAFLKANESSSTDPDPPLRRKRRPTPPRDFLE